jgi:hypothetical protein
LWSTAAQVLYGANITISNSYPIEILAVGFPMNATTDGDTILLNFLDAVATLVSGNVSVFNITAFWRESKPVNVTPTLSQLLNITYPLLISQEQTRLVRAPFYTDYAVAHDGRLPFVVPVPLVRWGFGDNSTATISEAVANKTLFMDWFNSEVLVSREATCSDKLLIYVSSEADTDYRNEYLGPPQVPLGFSISRVSGFAEVPDMVVPSKSLSGLVTGLNLHVDRRIVVGQAKYESTVTNLTEYLPVTVDIMAAKRCDGMIFSLVEDLFHAGNYKCEPSRNEQYEWRANPV